MTEAEKWDFILKLDEELLKGGVILSEWSTFLARDAETAFCSGANLAAILAAQAAIESHLRYEYFSPKKSEGWGLYRMINELSKGAQLDPELVRELHELRRYRNKWVHVKDPADDQDLITKPDYFEDELEDTARHAIKTMLRVLYLEQWV